MNRIRTLLATATVLAFVPFAAFAQGDNDSEGAALTMTSVHTLAAGTFTQISGSAVPAFSAAFDFGTVALTYSTNSVAQGATSTITAVAGAWSEPAGFTAAFPILKATASAPDGIGSGTEAAQVTLIDGANLPAGAQTLVTGITNGQNSTTTVTFAVDASDETIADGAYSTTVTFTLTASAGGV